MEGIVAGVVFLFLGFPVAVLFNSFVQGQDPIVLLLVLVAFGACVGYGEANMTMPSGVAFGIGLLMTGFAALSVWPIGLGTMAVVISLVKYALAPPDEIEAEDVPPQPGGVPV